MNVKSIALGGVAYTAIANAINAITSTLSRGYYASANPGVWSALFMPGNAPPSISFLAVSVLFGLIIGTIFAWAYSVLKSSIPGRNKGISYGLMLFLVAGIPYILPTYALLGVPVAILLTWAVSDLIIYITAGIVFHKIIG